MDIRIPRPLAALVFLIALCASTAPARADTSNCTVISSLPYAINTPGPYCLAGNLTFAGTGPQAIRINQSNVTLDCNHHVVSQTGVAQSAGVYFAGRSDVIVRNCTFRGFYRGIHVLGAAARSQRVELLDNTIVGARYAGIQADLRNSGIHRNRVLDTSGATGIQVGVDAGGIVSIHDNLVRGISGAGQVNGILVSGAGRAFIEHNQLAVLGTGSTAVAAAIRVNSDAGVSPLAAVIEDNQMFLPTAVRNLVVIRANTTKRSLCSDNVVINSGGSVVWEASNGCL